MKCSRCGSSVPLKSCYVCAAPELDEPNAFLAADEWLWHNEPANGFKGQEGHTAKQETPSHEETKSSTTTN